MLSGELGGCDPRCRAARRDCQVSRERCTTERRTAATAVRSSICTTARPGLLSALRPGHVCRGHPQLTLYSPVCRGLSFNPAILICTSWGRGEPRLVIGGAVQAQAVSANHSFVLNSGPVVKHSNNTSLDNPAFISSLIAEYLCHGRLLPVRAQLSPVGQQEFRYRQTDMDSKGPCGSIRG